jgi:hypothetical protein
LDYNPASFQPKFIKPINLYSMKTTTNQMKRLIFTTVLAVGFVTLASSQNIRFNAYSGYVFDDNSIDAYASNTNYYSGAIKGGYQWGGGLEYMASETKGIEIKYLRQDADAPMDYYNVIKQHKDFELAINYILLGGSNYFKTGNDKVEPYAGFGVGAAIINVKNPSPNTDSSLTKFAWNLKLGTNIWLNEKIGLKLQAQLLSAVQSVGGSVYFGTGGSGAGVSSYSSMLQFELGGGLVFKLGK